MTEGNLAVRTDVTRRSVLEMGAWSAPALMLAVALPQSVASGLGDPDPAPDPEFTAVDWSQTGQLTSNGVRGGRSTGFLPFSDTDALHATDSWVDDFPDTEGGNTQGFLSMDDSDGTSDIATVTARYTFQAKAGTAYLLKFDLATWYGGSGVANSSRQSLEIVAATTGQADKRVYAVTISHPDGQDGSLATQGYEIITSPSKTPSPVERSFSADADGTYTLELRFTIQPKQTGQDKYCADMWLRNLTLTAVA